MIYLKLQSVPKKSPLLKFSSILINNPQNEF